jgi:trehalose 6-phosphate synthase
LSLSLRFVLPLLIVLAAIAYGVTSLADQLTLRWFVRDLDMRAKLVANAIETPMQDLVRTGQRVKVVEFMSRMLQDERLYALGFCDAADGLQYRTGALPPELTCEYAQVLQAGPSHVLQLESGPLHIAVQPISSDTELLGRLVLVHDMSFVTTRSATTKRYVFYLFIGLGLVVSLMTVLIAQLSLRGWVRGLREVISGEGLFRPVEGGHPRELQPVVKDLRMLIRDLESERRSRDESQVSWAPESLRTVLREDLRGDQILIVSNREPYIHAQRDGRVVVQRPASGLVTALEPVMLACSGTWIAHGSGSADREMVDARDHVAVPPERPGYALRRVWLTPEQEEGYYYGFANEGLWPLCHIAHTRPVFRASDWSHYVTVNGEFARAVEQEATTDDPVVLVQDYHFAPLPRLIRERLPKATVICFWHIPWPNPEAFAICPWAEQILEGMLGSSILGFHTRFHCNNFLDSVDRLLEARVDRETSTVHFRGNRTAVKRYPISIEWPLSGAQGLPSPQDCHRLVRERHGLAPDARVVVGVDRLDYTKGIPERMLAIERLLELEPGWIGKLVLLQIGAPSRSRIPEYRDFQQRVEAEALRINQRFGRDSYRPIVLRAEHCEHEEVYRYYRAADACMVTSLHDGMNLVAKEFVATREDEQGVLILSQFTGASRELAEALIVNPYHIDQCAAAVQVALSMSPADQRSRMRSMRALIQEFNVYRWAGRMLLDAAVMRRRSRVLGEEGGMQG